MENDLYNLAKGPAEAMHSVNKRIWGAIKGGKKTMPVYSRSWKAADYSTGPVGEFVHRENNPEMGGTPIPENVPAPNGNEVPPVSGLGSALGLCKLCS